MACVADCDFQKGHNTISHPYALPIMGPLCVKVGPMFPLFRLNVPVIKTKIKWQWMSHGFKELLPVSLETLALVTQPPSWEEAKQPRAKATCSVLVTSLSWSRLITSINRQTCQKGAFSCFQPLAIL